MPETVAWTPSAASARLKEAPVAARRPLSGARFDLEHGRYRASVAGIGASLRMLQHDARDLVLPFGVDEVRPAYRGAVLAPWPNRVSDGAYRFADVEQQLPLSEPARGHALHGLALWLDFTPVARSVDQVVLAATIEPQAGYPHRIALEVEYRLDDDGLHQSVTARNTGSSPAPFGTGPHPYLVAGPGPLDEWVLDLPAGEILTVTPERLLPIGVSDVTVEDGGVFDFRTPRLLGATVVDHAFTSLHRDAEGFATVRLTGPDGTGVAMRFDRSCEWVQVCTADSAIAEYHRAGLAVEPMTCPPDAFNSGCDLIVLAPDAATTASWDIAALV